MQYGATGSTGNSAMNEGMFRTLDDLYRTSRLMLGKNTITLEDTRQLAGYVTQVRVMLAELEHLEIKLHRSPAAMSSITGLKERYLELEGMVKEARNSLHRKSQATLSGF